MMSAVRNGHFGTATGRGNGLSLPPPDLRGLLAGADSVFDSSLMQTGRCRLESRASTVNRRVVWRIDSAGRDS